MNKMYLNIIGFVLLGFLVGAMIYVAVADYQGDSEFMSIGRCRVILYARFGIVAVMAITMTVALLKAE